MKIKFSTFFKRKARTISNKPQSGDKNITIFISYSRINLEIVSTLANKLSCQNIEIWFDKEIEVGQEWWDIILSAIRSATVFIAVLSPDYIDSVPCNLELEYASSLNKLIIPILVSEDVDFHELPSILQKTHIINYRDLDELFIDNLPEILRKLPETTFLPISPPPQAPISPLGDIKIQLKKSQLSHEMQVSILIKLKDLVSKIETRPEAIGLLEQLRKHPDLRAPLLHEIEIILGDSSIDEHSVASYGTYLTSSTNEFVSPHDEFLLPRALSFVGHKTELEWLNGKFKQDNQLISIYGMGGIGKTALVSESIHCNSSRDFCADGIVVILCEGINDATYILRAIISRFDIYNRFPPKVNIARLNDIVRRLLKNRKILIVLEGIEPNTKIANVVNILLSTGATVLIISRHELPRNLVLAANTLKVGLLSDQESEELFLKAYETNLSDGFSQKENKAIQSIVMLLEFHPLAIRIISSFAADSHTDLEVLALDLEKDISKVLEVQDEENILTLAIVFKKSVNSLPREAYLLFASLYLFETKAFGRRALGALATSVSQRDPVPDDKSLIVIPEPILDENVALLARRGLIEISLNRVMPDGSDRQRVHVHSLIRAFSEDLSKALENSTIYQANFALSSYYFYYLKSNAENVIDIDEANIYTFLRWAKINDIHYRVVEICLEMIHYWEERHHYKAALCFLPWGLAAAELMVNRVNPKDDLEKVARLAFAFGKNLQNEGKPKEAEYILRKSLKIYQELKEDRGVCNALLYIGHTKIDTDQLDIAEEIYTDMLNIAKLNHDQGSEEAALGSLGRLEFLRGNFELSEDLLKKSIEIIEGVSNYNKYISLENLGEIKSIRGDIQEAEKYFLQCLHVASLEKEDTHKKRALRTLSKFYQSTNQPVEALKFLEQLLNFIRGSQDVTPGDERSIIQQLEHLATAFNLKSEAERYHRMLEET